LVAKEFIQLSRDWVMAAFILTLPVVQLALLAHVTGSRIANLDVAVLDLDRSKMSRQLVATLDSRRELEVRYFSATVAETERLLDQGRAALVVVIPPGFSEAIADAVTAAELQVIADASNSVPARYALEGARAAVDEFARDLARRRGHAADVALDLRTEIQFNPALNVKYFTVPAQVGFIIYQVTLTVASVGLARERELGTLEQLMVMPLRRMELVAGKAVPALIAGFVNFLLMLALTVFVFDVPMRGSLLLLVALTLVFIAAEVGYGILISSVARTQQQAILFVFVLAMVDMTFSGYLVRVKNLPWGLRAISRVVPFHHYLVLIRSIMLKGAGLDALWPHVAAILALGILVTMIATYHLSYRSD
jgi:ABC-2 type transport system permease protein